MICFHNLRTIASQEASYPSLGFTFLPVSLLPSLFTAMDTMMGENSRSKHTLQFPPFSQIRTVIVVPWTSVLVISGSPIKMPQTECPK